MNCAILVVALLQLLIPSTQPAEWHDVDGCTVGIFSMKSAPFPHESRAQGFTVRDGTTFPADVHYADDSVGILIPPGYRPSDSVHFVVHFHGHRNHVANVIEQFDLAKQLAGSGVNAILVIPQGPYDAPDSGFGRLEEADGLKNLLSEVANKLKADGKTTSPTIGSVVVTAHSGGYKATAACIARGGVAGQLTDVLLFDATYGGLDQFADFAAGASHRMVSIFTEHLASENYMLLAMLQAKQFKFTLLMEDRWKPEELLPRQSIFIHTRDLAHNEVVSKRDYFSLFLKTSALPQR